MSALSVSRGTPLARLDEIADPGALVVHIGSDGRSILLTRRAAAIAAFDNRCPHAGYPLQHADGRVLIQQQRYLVCGAHGASYELSSGACAGGPCNGKPLTRIAVTVRDGVICVA